MGFFKKHFRKKEDKYMKKEVKKETKKSKSLKLIESILDKYKKIQEKELSLKKNPDKINPKDKEELEEKQDKLANKVNEILSKNEEDLLEEFNDDEKILHALFSLGREFKKIQRGIIEVEKDHSELVRSPHFGMPYPKENPQDARDRNKRQIERYVEKLENLKERQSKIMNKRKKLWEKLGEDVAFELSKLRIFQEFTKSS